MAPPLPTVSTGATINPASHRSPLRRGVRRSTATVGGVGVAAEVRQGDVLQHRAASGRGAAVVEPRGRERRLRRWSCIRMPLGASGSWRSWLAPLAPLAPLRRRRWRRRGLVGRRGLSVASSAGRRVINVPARRRCMPRPPLPPPSAATRAGDWSVRCRCAWRPRRVASP